LREYCLQDVKVTKEVYEYGLKNKQVKYRDRLGQTIGVNVQFELEKNATQPINLTMPF
jgi:hypothetical protein